MAIIQGSSAIATPAKQDGLFGIHQMFARRKKSYNGTVIFADLFCGSGTNYVGDQIIDGSPITILKAVVSAVQTFRDAPHQYRCGFVFSDISPDRSIESLPIQVERFQREYGLPVDRDNLIVSNRFGTYTMPIHYVGASAEEMIVRVGTLMRSTNCRVMLTIDPNGPKALPVDALRDLWSEHKRRLTLNLHIAATHLKRCGKAALATGYAFEGIPPNLAALVKVFTDDPHGWIRKAIGADQWVLMMITLYEPTHGWGKDVLKMSQRDARDYIVELSLTNKEKKANENHDRLAPAL